jgi:methyltransferase (TIGR00027 family)
VGVKRSRTAQGVAAERAVLTDMGVLADPFARGMLAPSTAAIFWVVQRLPYRLRARSVTQAGLAARVLWYDAQVANALDAGIDQIVVIGAGYDSRAWRFRRDGLRFFEVDHGATQQDKARRAPGPGPTYVEADLTTQSAAEALLAYGLDASRPALFVAEGLTMYLDEEVVRRQLGDLAESSAVGSRLAVDFYPPRDAGTSQHHRQNRLQSLARAGSGETLGLLIDRPGAVELVERSGWDVTEETSALDAARTLVPRESGLPVDAINEHKTLVAGVRQVRSPRRGEQRPPARRGHWFGTLGPPAGPVIQGLLAALSRRT